VTAPGRRKVAVVVPKYGTIGGGERFVFELTERVARDPRYEVHVYANRWRPGSAPVTFHKVPRIPFPRFARQAAFAWLAGRLLAKGAFDLIHAHDRVFRADVFTMHSIPHETWVREVRGRRPTLFDRVTAWVERRLMEGGDCAWYLPVSTIARDAYRGSACCTRVWSANGFRATATQPPGPRFGGDTASATRRPWSCSSG
jgi:UDP-glucose:(heptosyl)LPS alpha-1,3-glucosyltransferase